MISAGFTVHQDALGTSGLHSSQTESVAHGSRTDDGVCSGPGRAGFTTSPTLTRLHSASRAKGGLNRPHSEPCLWEPPR
jgi:hypothetical protein